MCGITLCAESPVVSHLSVRLLLMAAQTDPCPAPGRSFNRKKCAQCFQPLHRGAPACQTEMLAFGTQFCPISLDAEGVWAHEEDTWPSMANPRHELGVKSALEGTMLPRHSDKHMPPCMLFFKDTYFQLIKHLGCRHLISMKALSWSWKFMVAL